MAASKDVDLGASWVLIGSSSTTAAAAGAGTATDAAKAPTRVPSVPPGGGIGVGGDVLADLMREPTRSRGGGGTLATALAAHARETEERHELVALVGHHLTINYGNYGRFREASDSAAPTMVVSFLGDTAVGKSTCIRELMGRDEDRPYVQRSSDQSASTTCNVNLFPCSSLLSGMTINFLDFEGEGGSAAPVMMGGAAPGKAAGARGVSTWAAAPPALSMLAAVAHAAQENRLPTDASALTTATLLTALPGLQGMGRRDAASILDRSREVREHFPRLAYTASDVVVLIGVDKLFGSRYLERALAFAKAANTNVQDVELPVLLIIANKVDVDECEMNMERTTRLFQERMGRDLSQLDAYFSCVVVCQLPNIKTTAVTGDGRMLIGSEMFAEQIAKLRTLLASLLNSRLQDREKRLAGGGGPGRRIITSRQGLWYAMLPLIVAQLNSGAPVHVSRLVDEAWAASMSSIVGGEAPMDAFKTIVTVLRPPPALSERATRFSDDVLLRFNHFCGLACDVAVRIIAGRLRALDPALLFDDKVEVAARPQIETLLRLLDDITPCCAVYGSGGGGGAGIFSSEWGVPVDRVDEPILCLQERRVHAKGHRGSRRVKGGGPSLWKRLLAILPYNPTWPGDFAPAHVSRPDARSLLSEAADAVRASPSEHELALLHLQASYTCAATAIDYVVVPLQPAAEVAADRLCGEHGTPLRLRRRRAAEWVVPYCACCARRVAAAAPPDDASPAPATAAGAASAPTGSGGEAAEAGFGAWAGAVFTELLALASGSGGTATAAGATAAAGAGSEAASGGPRGVTFGGEAGASAGRAGGAARGGLKRLPPSAAPAAAALEGGAGAALPQQTVALALCLPCATAVTAAVREAAAAAAAAAAATVGSDGEGGSSEVGER